MKDALTPAKDWLLLNACECWLYYFPNHKWSETYKELKDELMKQLIDKTNEEPPITPVKRTAVKPKPSTTRP